MKLRQTARNLHFQELESRTMMAGDVTASFSSLTGLLKLDGDALGNGMDVATLNDGTLRVTGKLAAGSNTTINGSSFKDFRDVKGLQINMAGGSDQVNFGSALNATKLSQNFVADMGSGNDQLKVNNLIIEQDIEVQLGAGGDLLSMDHVVAKDDMLIKAGSGFDSIEAEFLFVGIGNTDSGNNDLVVDMEGGGGWVFLRNLAVHREMLVSSSLNGVTDRSDTSTYLSIDNATVGNNLGVGGGNAIDSIYLKQIKVGKMLNVLTNDGDDAVKLVDVETLDGVMVDLGKGNDSLHLEDITTLGQLFVSGGVGQDKLDIVGSLSVGDFVKNSFEL